MNGAYVDCSLGALETCPTVVLTGGPLFPPPIPFGGVGGAVGIVGARAPLLACIKAAKMTKRAKIIPATVNKNEMIHIHRYNSNFLTFHCCWFNSGGLLSKDCGFQKFFETFYTKLKIPWNHHNVYF